MTTTTQTATCRCPTCFAAPGTPCKTRHGRIVKGSHLRRYAAEGLAQKCRDEQARAIVNGAALLEAFHSNLDLIADAINAITKRFAAIEHGATDPESGYDKHDAKRVATLRHKIAQSIDRLQRECADWAAELDYIDEGADGR